MNNKLDENQGEKFDSDFDETKRKSLIKMGKRAVYVAPVVLTLLTSQKASAISPSGGGVSSPKPHGGRPHHGKRHQPHGGKRHRPMIRWWKWW